MKNLAVIPARCGSKGIRNKNMKLLNGKPLMAGSIETAIESGVFDTVHVSTDSGDYAKTARKYGADVPFLRSAETSSDTASSWDTVLEVLGNYEHLGKTFDAVMLLQPTSPLRTAEDIRNACQLLEEKEAAAVVSVCETEYPPLWCNTLPRDGCMDGFVQPEAEFPRQQLKTYYRINGAIYMVSVSALQKWKDLIYGSDCYAYIMPRERSIDIDEPVDFLIAETLLRSQGPFCHSKN